MPSEKKNRGTKLESDSFLSPSPSREIAYVSESDYDSVLDFMRGLKGASIPSDLRASVRKVASEWLRYVSWSLLFVTLLTNRSTHETGDDDEE
jgi:hypothetical protein